MPTVRGLQFSAAVRFAFPSPRSDALVSEAQLVEHGQQHAEGVLADGISVAFGAAVNSDAEFRSHLEVDVLQTRSTSRNPSEVRKRAKHLLVETDAASQHHAMNGRASAVLGMGEERLSDSIVASWQTRPAWVRASCNAGWTVSRNHTCSLSAAGPMGIRSSAWPQASRC